MKIKLASINLDVADPQKSKRLYLDALGMVEDTDRSHGQGFVYLTSEGCDMTLATGREAHPAEPSNTIEIGFEVDDLEAAKAKLIACGFDNFKRQSMGWGNVIELHDLDGFRVIVYQFSGR